MSRHDMPYAEPAMMIEDVDVAHSGRVIAPSRVPRRTLVQRTRAVADAAIVILAHSVAVLLYLPNDAIEISRGGKFSIIVVLTVATLGALYSPGQRHALLPPVRALTLQAILRASGLTLLSWLLVAGILSFELPLDPALVDLVMVVGGLTTVRVVFRIALGRAHSAGLLRSRTVIVGTGMDARTIEQVVADNQGLGLDIVGVVGSAENAIEHGVRSLVVGDVSDDVIQVIRRMQADTVIVTSVGLRDAGADHIVRSLLQHGVDVLFHNGLRTLSVQRVKVHPFGYEPLLHISPPKRRPVAQFSKRAFDLVLASVALLLAAPVLAVAAFAIRREDGGGPVFRQQRVGQDGVPFTLLKLRTMEHDAESRLAELQELNHREGPLFKLENDPRITRVGRILRATSIDELPQLINVLRGEMSLVGPRPALESEAATFDQDLLARMSVTPGITGLWQVEARESASFDAYRRLDLYYVENWSLSLDMSILATTVRSVLGRAWSSMSPRGVALS